MKWEGSCLEKVIKKKKSNERLHCCFTKLLDEYPRSLQTSWSTGSCCRSPRILKEVIKQQKHLFLMRRIFLPFPRCFTQGSDGKAPWNWTILMSTGPHLPALQFSCSRVAVSWTGTVKSCVFPTSHKQTGQQLMHISCAQSSFYYSLPASAFLETNDNDPHRLTAGSSLCSHFWSKMFL